MDSKIGAIVAKDENGNIIKTIKTRNTDGISIFGNRWQNIPNKLAEALGITPKTYKEMMANILKEAESNTYHEQ
jgi:hypothetical protein